MRAEFLGADNAAFERERAFGNQRRGNFACLCLGKPAFFEFIDLAPSIDAAVVNFANHLRRGQVDDAFAAFFEQLVAVAALAQ